MEQKQIDGLINRLSEVHDQEAAMADFRKAGGLYKSQITVHDGFQIDVLLLQVQKSFGDEVHLIWDTKFAYPHSVGEAN